MLRNIYDWDCGTETNFWEIICDKPYKIEHLPSKTRNQIRRCLRDCEIKQLTNEELVKANGYNVYAESFKRYHDIVIDVSTREKWEKNVLNSSKCEYWGVFKRDNNMLIAWGMNTIHGVGVNYNTLKAIPEYMNKHYPYFGLLFEMNKHYLSKRGFKYVSDGCRSITEHSNIQPFLEKNFLFRKAYCKLKIYYKWWLRVGIILLYPLRSILPSSQLKNLLKFEEINRENV